MRPLSRRAMRTTSQAQRMQKTDREPDVPGETEHDVEDDNS